MSRIALTIVLEITWILLWGDASLGNIIGGFVVIAVLLAVFDQPLQPHRHRFSPIGTARLLGRFMVDLVVSSARILVTVVLPRGDRLRSGIVRVELSCDSPLVTKAVSDLLCLTPGTLTVEVDADPPVLYVHVLGLTDPDELRREIVALEARVLAALPLDEKTRKERGRS
jgi:multicomponent Na+:H+ antiporter subunit E